MHAWRPGFGKPRGPVRVDFEADKADPFGPSKRDELHVSPVLATDLVERSRYLAQGGDLGGLHEHLEYVADAKGRLLQGVECHREHLGVMALEQSKLVEPALLVVVGRPDQFFRRLDRRTGR